MAEVGVSIVTSARFKRLARELPNLLGTPELAAAKRQIGALALQDQRGHFREAAAPGAGLWPALSDVTVILRRRGSGGKIVDQADVEAKRGRLAMLQDTNRLFQSLTPAASGNIFEVLADGVRVGTNVAYGRLHQRGGAATFRFGAEEERRFEENVSKVLRGARTPRARKDGKRRAWKAAGKASPWNPFFFRWRAVLRKMHGKRYHVPARVFLRRPTGDEAAKYGRLITAAVRKIGR